MSRCHCGAKAVIATQHELCQDHFIEGFELKVKNTIERFGLIKNGDHVVVACSGGKDSTVLLYLIQKFGYDVSALAINEGIDGYRDETLENLQEFCDKYAVRLQVHSYETHFGVTLDDAMQKISDTVPCRVCGVWRRYLLNKYAHAYDVIASGHNLDDEAQNILMNLIKANTQISARLGPVSGVVADNRFVRKVKPLYLCPEKEVAAYAFLKNFGIAFSECPNANDTFRTRIRILLNDIERDHKGSKRHLVETFLNEADGTPDHASKKILSCHQCGQPAGGRLCRACTYAKELSPALQASQPIEASRKNT